MQYADPRYFIQLPILALLLQLILIVQQYYNNCRAVQLLFNYYALTIRLVGEGRRPVSTLSMEQPNCQSGHEKSGHSSRQKRGHKKLKIVIDKKVGIFNDFT